MILRAGDEPHDLTVLIDAMWQLLDDMGETGTSVSIMAKAQARIAFEPFRDPDIHGKMDYVVEHAQEVLRQADR